MKLGDHRDFTTLRLVETAARQAGAWTNHTVNFVDIVPWEYPSHPPQQKKHTLSSPQSSAFKWHRDRNPAQIPREALQAREESYRQAACLSLLAKSNAEKWIPLLISVVLTVAVREPEVRDMTPNYGHCRLIILMEKMKEREMGGEGGCIRGYWRLGRELPQYTGCFCEPTVQGENISWGKSSLPQSASPIIDTTTCFQTWDETACFEW